MPTIVRQFAASRRKRTPSGSGDAGGGDDTDADKRRFGIDEVDADADDDDADESGDENEDEDEDDDEDGERDDDVALAAEASMPTVAATRFTYASRALMPNKRKHVEHESRQNSLCSFDEDSWRAALRRRSASAPEGCGVAPQI